MMDNLLAFLTFLNLGFGLLGTKLLQGGHFDHKPGHPLHAQEYYKFPHSSDCSHDG